MSRNKVVLVTGGTGLLGKGMVETGIPGYRIVSLHQRSYAVVDSQAKHLVLDIRDRRAVERLFAQHKFDAVIHAAGIASVDYVEKHYAESLESNIVGTLNITSACRKAGVYLVYISTNAVFDGKSPPYRETDAINPVNKYGRLKAECERLVSETLREFCIMRPILMYGWNHIVARPNTVTWIYDKLIRGEKIEVVDDIYENPLFNHQCGHALWNAVRKRPGGVFHLAGKDAVSRYQFALKIAKAFELDAALIRRVGSAAFPDIAPRPQNTSFVTERMEGELGVRPMSLDEGLRAMKADMGVKA